VMTTLIVAVYTEQNLLRNTQTEMQEVLRIVPTIAGAQRAPYKDPAVTQRLVERLDAGTRGHWKLVSRPRLSIRA
jgi:hypothetical protein